MKTKDQWRLFALLLGMSTLFGILAVLVGRSAYGKSRNHEI